MEKKSEVQSQHSGVVLIEDDSMLGTHSHPSFNKYQHPIILPLFMLNNPLPWMFQILWMNILILTPHLSIILSHV